MPPLASSWLTSSNNILYKEEGVRKSQRPAPPQRSTHGSMQAWRPPSGDREEEAGAQWREDRPVSCWGLEVYES